MVIWEKGNFQRNYRWPPKIISSAPPGIRETQLKNFFLYQIGKDKKIFFLYQTGKKKKRLMRKLAFSHCWWAKLLLESNIYWNLICTYYSLNNSTCKSYSAGIFTALPKSVWIKDIQYYLIYKGKEQRNRNDLNKKLVKQNIESHVSIKRIK